MTRGRHRNTAHLVADSLDDARSQWIEMFSRDRADLGPTHAAAAAAEAIERYGANLNRPSSTLQAAALRGKLDLTPAVQREVSASRSGASPGINR